MSNNSEFHSKLENEFTIVETLSNLNVQAKVYKVQRNKETFALKCYCLVNARRDEPTYDERCAQKEINALKSMKHRNIVNYVEDWTEVRPPGWKYKGAAVNLNNAEKVHFVLMEYCAQGDLVNWCQQQQRELSEIKKIFAQIVDAVAFFHSMGVLHRDMKLANCFITEKDQVKVGDFGLSTEYAEMMTSRPGTELYRAPEIRERGRQQYTEKVDVYSLGLLYYEMLSGLVQCSDEWYTAVTDLRDKGISSPIVKEFIVKHSNESILLGLMLSHHPDLRLSVFEIRDWLEGRYFYHDAKCVTIGTLTEETRHVRFLNAEYMLEKASNGRQMKYSQNVVQKLGLCDITSLRCLKTFTVEFGQHRHEDGTEEPPVDYAAMLGGRDDLSVEYTRKNLENLMSLGGKVEDWASNIDVLLVDHKSETKFLHVNQSKKSVAFMIPFPNELRNTEFRTLSIFRPQGPDIDRLFQHPNFENLTSLNINRAYCGWTVNFNTEYFPVLKHLYLSFMEGEELEKEESSIWSRFLNLISRRPPADAKPSVNITAFQLPDLETLFLGNVIIDFAEYKERQLPKLSSLAFTDCIIRNFDSAAGMMHVQEFAFFCDDKIEIYTFDLFDNIIGNDYVKCIYYDSICKPAGIERNFQIGAYLIKSCLRLESLNVEFSRNREVEMVPSVISSEARIKKLDRLNGDFHFLAALR